MMGGSEFNRDLKELLWKIAGYTVYISLLGLLLLKLWLKIK
jgi:hypothetical protein